MKLSGINYESFADGEGVRVSVFVSGCHRHCAGCFNKETQDFNFGDSLTQDICAEIYEYLNKPYISGLTMLGGEPMDEENIEGTYQVIMLAKALRKTVWVYSGYTLEELWLRTGSCMGDILRNTDVLVDGPFILEQRDTTLAFRGSSNQRIIDVQESLRVGEVIPYKI